MSGIYIPKAKIPDGDYVRVLMLHKDGTCIDGIGNIFKVISVPNHGDLIDRNAARGCIKPWSPEDERNGCTFDTVKKLMHTMLDRAPTIIPADKEGE